MNKRRDDTIASGTSGDADATAIVDATTQALGREAILVGDCFGMVEGVNALWSEWTGLTANETVHKPISHFLDVAGIELGLVEFVGQHFRAGRRCQVVFPFVTRAGRTIDVHLEVEPLRDARGEIGSFRAVARELPARESGEAATARGEPRAAHDEVDGPARPHRAADREPGRPETRAESDPTAATRRTHVALSLSARADALSRAWLEAAPSGTLLDRCFEDELPEIVTDPAQLDRLIQSLLRAAAESAAPDTPCITLLTGRTKRHRSHVSRAYAIAARPAILAECPCVYLEVHTTADAFETAALEQARQRVAALDAALHLDATPGCGAQALLLFPIRNPDR